MNNKTEKSVKKAKIHPLIQNIKISEKVKSYFNRLEFYEIIEYAVLLSTASYAINECMENQWSFGVELKYCNASDILAFYRAIIGARKQYLIDNNIDIKMIFYTWYDPISGHFYFSVIPQNWSKLSPDQELPFGCTVNKVKKLEDIIANFVNDSYKGRIPIHKLEEVDPSEDTENDEDPKSYILDVWSTIL